MHIFSRTKLQATANFGLPINIIGNNMDSNDRIMVAMKVNGDEYLF
jgi:hypothetical protein